MYLVKSLKRNVGSPIYDYQFTINVLVKPAYLNINLSIYPGDKILSHQNKPGEFSLDYYWNKDRRIDICLCVNSNHVF